jgi:hypothetical protein
MQRLNSFARSLSGNSRAAEVDGKMINTTPSLSSILIFFSVIENSFVADVWCQIIVFGGRAKVLVCRPTVLVINILDDKSLNTES